VVNGDLEDVCIPRGFAAAVIKWRDLSTWVKNGSQSHSAAFQKVGPPPPLHSRLVGGWGRAAALAVYSSGTIPNT
jgi:hypothetical protein